MAYFGGGGVTERLHPSLQVYIDCFESSPFPRGWPRRGGIWNQDPILVRDFRAIRDYEIQWKQAQENNRAVHGGGNWETQPLGSQGRPPGLEGMLDKYVKSMEEGEPF